jgi:hypothetical protein
VRFSRLWLWRMASSRMLRRVALVRTDASDELSASETSVLTRSTRRNIPEDAILHKTVKSRGIIMTNAGGMPRQLDNCQLNSDRGLHRTDEVWSVNNEASVKTNYHVCWKSKKGRLYVRKHVGQCGRGCAKLKGNQIRNSMQRERLQYIGWCLHIIANKLP